MSMASDLGQTAIVAVLSITVVVSLLGVVLVQTVGQLLPAPADQVGADLCEPRPRGRRERLHDGHQRQLRAWPSAAPTPTAPGPAAGLNYGKWNVRRELDRRREPTRSTTPSAIHIPDFRSDQPTPSSACPCRSSARPTTLPRPNGYLFDQETITVTPKNGFLQNVWWSNYESYSSTGQLLDLQLQLRAYGYNIDNKNIDCSPVYFGPGDYLFGPVFTNDSVFVSGNGTDRGLAVVRHA